MSNELITTACLPRTFAEVGELATDMAIATFLPEHFRGQWVRKPDWQKKDPGEFVGYPPEVQRANARLVINAALTYEMDPFALAKYSFVVGGKLDFNGLVYKALADHRAGLAEKLSVQYAGEGDDRLVIVSGRLAGESQPRTVEAHYLEARTVERKGARKGQVTSQWEDVDQMLAYHGCRRWVRRHVPGVLLGLGEALPDDNSYQEPQRPAIDRQPKPESQQRLEDAGPSEAYRKLWEQMGQIEYNVAECKLFRSKIENKGVQLKDKEQEQLLEELYLRYRKANPPKPEHEPPVAKQPETLPGIVDADSAALVAQYDSEIGIADPSELEELMGMVREDDRLTADDKDRLIDYCQDRLQKAAI